MFHTLMLGLTAANLVSAVGQTQLPFGKWYWCAKHSDVISVISGMHTDFIIIRFHRLPLALRLRLLKFFMAVYVLENPINEEK